MGIKEDYSQAVKLAKEGKFIEAKELIIVYNDPRTKKLVEKLNTAIFNSQAHSNVKTDPLVALRSWIRRTAFIILLVGTLIFGIFIAVVDFFDGFNRFDAYNICQDYGCDSDELLNNYRDDLIQCRNEEKRYDLSPIAYASCMQIHGVPFRNQAD